MPRLYCVVHHSIELDQGRVYCPQVGALAEQRHAAGTGLKRCSPMIQDFRDDVARYADYCLPSDGASYDVHDDVYPGASPNGITVEELVHAGIKDSLGLAAYYIQKCKPRELDDFLHELGELHVTLFERLDKASCAAVLSVQEEELPLKPSRLVQTGKAYVECQVPLRCVDHCWTNDAAIRRLAKDLERKPVVHRLT